MGARVNGRPSRAGGERARIRTPSSNHPRCMHKRIREEGNMVFQFRVLACVSRACHVGRACVVLGVGRVHSLLKAVNKWVKLPDEMDTRGTVTTRHR